MDKSTLIAEWGTIFDTHEHYGVFDPNFSLKSTKISLSKIINGSYLHVPEGDSTDYDAMVSQLKVAVGSDAFFSLRTGFKALYDIDIYPLNSSSLKLLDERIQAAYQKPKYILDILQKKAKIDTIILDIPAPIWKNWEHPLFRPTIRIDNTIYPFTQIYGQFVSKSNTKSDVEQYAEKNRLPFESLDDFDEVLEKYVESLRSRASVIKIGSAYQRTIEFQMENNPDKQIDAIFAKFNQPRARFSQEEMLRWGNYIVTFLVSYASVEHLPIQIHTGLALMEGSNPVNLAEFTRAFPQVTFCIFHGGYPYHSILPGLLYTRANMYADLCWMPILNRSATKDILRDIIAVGQWHKTFAFGGDCQTIEGSYGALLVLQDILAEILLNLIHDGKITQEDAIMIGRAMLHDNAQRVFQL